MNTDTQPTTTRSTQTLLSVVLPVYNEVAILRQLTIALRETCDATAHPYEIVYVNDGSRDGSAELLDELASQDTRIRIVHLSRNFGHQPAVQAGLEYARGEVVILMDSDQQDDPRAIPQMLQKWREGYDVVYAQRFNRKESFAKRTLFFAFYRVLNRIAATPIPKDAGVFGLIDRTVVEQMIAVGDQDRFLPGIRSWVGFRQTGIPVERLARHDETPRISVRQLFRLAQAAIFGFSRTPLAFFYWITGCSLLVLFFSSGFTLYHRLISGLAIPGWTSITIVASLFGALNAMGICVLGEYVIRIYDQVRGRPQYIVARTSVSAEVDEESAVISALNELNHEISEFITAPADTEEPDVATPSNHPSDPATAFEAV